MPHITFIHGISNKPEEKKLKKIWLDALSHDLLRNDDGIDLGASGISTSMIYWADVLYDEPLKEGSFESAVAYENNESVCCAGRGRPIGSPLGLDEVQDKFAPEWTRENGFPEKLNGPG